MRLAIIAATLLLSASPAFADQAGTSGTVVASTKPAANRALLVEGSPTATEGAVLFLGTSHWSKGVDENGAPELIATATISGRSVGVEILIRMNADPTVPAEAVMEIRFNVPEAFPGGAIAKLTELRLGNDEFGQGDLLIGVSARVVGNSFLFALSGAPADVARNAEFLSSGRWMALDVIYSDGKQATVSLESDAAAQSLFRDVIATWRIGLN